MTFNEMRDSVKGTAYGPILTEVINQLELITDCLSAELEVSKLNKAAAKQAAIEQAEKAQAEVHAKIAADEQKRRTDKRAAQGVAI